MVFVFKYKPQQFHIIHLKLYPADITSNTAHTLMLLIATSPYINVHIFFKIHFMPFRHYSDVIMSAIASQITGVTIVYSTVCSGVDQRNHQSSASLDFVRGIHGWPVNSPHKGPVTRKMLPFDDVIMVSLQVATTHELKPELTLRYRAVLSLFKGSDVI